jgi:hypothetical protein
MLHAQLYAEVDSVSPADGSAAGGTLITISGRGFPDSSHHLLGNSLEVNVRGAPCKVEYSDYTTIRCRTPAEADAVAQISMDIDGTTFYPVRVPPWGSGLGALGPG